MDAMILLNRCRDAKAELGRLADRLTRLTECATNTTPRIGQTGGKPSGVNDKVSVFAVDIAETEALIQKRRKAYEAEVFAACKIVDMLPDPACGILYRYYVQASTIGGIGCALHLSNSYVKKVRKDGVRQVLEIPHDEVLRVLPAWYLEQIEAEGECLQVTQECP